MTVELKGGRCQVCGYSKCIWALDFHHYDESTKSFNLSTDGMTRSWARIKEEVSKCLLVCANCHREIHAGLIDISKRSSDVIITSVNK
jgi:hypothetical protein